MKIFANLFLILFAADGGLSLLDELAALFAPLAILSGARAALAETVLFMALILYFALGIDRRLPKRVFLPLILFVLCCPLLSWVFPPLAQLRTYGLITALAQVTLCLLPLSRFRIAGRRSLIAPPDLFVGPLFRLRHTLIFSGINLLVIPCALLVFGLYAANAYMATYTAGFMRLEPRGLFMTERVYRRGDRTIRLAGMIHVGDKAYYDDLIGSAAHGRTIVLAEGVTDERSRMQHRFDYGRVAGMLGLTSQEKVRFKGRIIEAIMPETPQEKAQAEHAPAQADILRADVDISDFRPETVRFLDTIGMYLQESKSVLKGVVALNKWAEKSITPAQYEVIMDDILTRRNRAVLGHLDRALVRYDTVLIPWGALHMKGIEEAVIRRGFTLQAEKKRASIDFCKKLSGG